MRNLLTLAAIIVAASTAAAEGYTPVIPGRSYLFDPSTQATLAPRKAVFDERRVYALNERRLQAETKGPAVYNLTPRVDTRGYDQPRGVKWNAGNIIEYRWRIHITDRSVSIDYSPKLIPMEPLVVGAP